MTPHEVRWPESVDAQVSINLIFTEPFIGAFGFREEQVAVDQAAVKIAAGKVFRVDGKGRAVRKSGEVGTKIVHAYGLGWDDLPDDVKSTVAQLYSEVMERTPRTLI